MIKKICGSDRQADPGGQSQGKAHQTVEGKEGGRQVDGLPDAQQQVLHQEYQGTYRHGPGIDGTQTSQPAGDGKPHGCRQVAESRQAAGPDRPDPDRQRKKPRLPVKLLVLEGIEDIETRHPEEHRPGQDQDWQAHVTPDRQPTPQRSVQFSIRRMSAKASV